MNDKKLNIGLIGHKFMGKAHSNALKDLPMFFDVGAEPCMKVICGVEDDISKAAERYGWETYETDWRKVVANPDIDIIDISSPGVTHMEIAIEAAKAGKHIICEKPLSMTAAEAKSMYDAVVHARVKNMVNFCYRRVPAVMLAKELITSGELGEIYHFKATYQQDWVDSDCPHVWRFDKKLAGAGAMADKGSHVIDLARFLVGEISEVTGASEIFIKKHKDLATGEMKEVTTDDATMFLTRFASGGLGVFETSRISIGYKNALQFEVNGSKGCVRFNLERLNELDVFIAEGNKATRGFKTILVTEPQHAYMKNWWPQGHIIGWEHLFIHQYYEFLKAIVEDRDADPSFYDGWVNMQIIEAIEKASFEKIWVKL
jgi:predicted dehydrogenase